MGRTCTEELDCTDVEQSLPVNTTETTTEKIALISISLVNMNRQR